MTWSTEAYALVTLVFTTLAGGVGWMANSWKDKGNEPMAQCEKRVEAAERREAEANARAKDERDIQNKHIDNATDAVVSQNKTIADLTAAIKTLTDGNREDMKKVTDGMATLLARSERDGRRT